MIELFTVENGIAWLTLTALQIVLGIDNIAFIAILTEKLGGKQAARARKIGLTLAVLIRLAVRVSSPSDQDNFECTERTIRLRGVH